MYYKKYFYALLIVFSLVHLGNIQSMEYIDDLLETYNDTNIPQFDSAPELFNRSVIEEQDSKTEKKVSYTCSLCDCIFKSRIGLRIHMTDYCPKRTEYTIYTCGFMCPDNHTCTYTSQTYNALYYHQRKEQHRVEKPPKKFACVFKVLGCKKTYSRQQNVDIHKLKCNFDPKKSSK